jgi:hypothetical protein
MIKLVMTISFSLVFPRSIISRGDVVSLNSLQSKRFPSSGLQEVLWCQPRCTYRQTLTWLGCSAGTLSCLFTATDGGSRKVQSLIWSRNHLPSLNPKFHCRVKKEFHRTLSAITHTHTHTHTHTGSHGAEEVNCGLLGCNSAQYLSGH